MAGAQLQPPIRPAEVDLSFPRCFPGNQEQSGDIQCSPPNLPYLCPEPVVPPEEGIWEWAVCDTPRALGLAQPPDPPDPSPGAQ